MSAETGISQHPEILFSEKVLKAPFRVLVNPHRCAEVLKDAGVQDPEEVTIALNRGKFLDEFGTFNPRENEITVNLRSKTTSMDASLAFAHEAKHASGRKIPWARAVLKGIRLGVISGSEIIFQASDDFVYGLLQRLLLFSIIGSYSTFFLGLAEYFRPEEIKARSFANQKKADIKSKTLPITILLDKRV